MYIYIKVNSVRAVDIQSFPQCLCFYVCIYIYIYMHIYIYMYIYIYIYINAYICLHVNIHRETMGLERGGLFVPKDDPTPQFRSFLVFFEGWSQIWPSTKVFRHGFEQSCSAMGTQKLKEKVQQHDEVVESSKTRCRIQSEAHGKAYEQVPALICDLNKQKLSEP